MKAHFWLSLVVVAVVFYAVGAMYPGWYAKAMATVKG